MRPPTAHDPPSAPQVGTAAACQQLATLTAWVFPAVGALAASLRCVDRAAAVAAGAVLVLAAVTLRDGPPARAALLRPSFAAGFVGVTAVFVALKALCAFTPYCVDEPVLWTS
jgi:hypothetical protein